MSISPEELDRILRKSVLLSRNSTEPLHAQLTRALRNLVLRNFEDGEAFYPEEILSDRLGLSVGTVRRSLTRLMEEGLLERHRGRGSFVRRNSGARQNGFRIEVLLNTYDSFFNRTLLRELSFLCQINGMLLDVINPGQDWRVADIQGFEHEAAERFGLIFLSLDADFTYDLFRSAEARGIPSVNIDTPIRGYPGRQIRVENARGIELGLAHLAQLEHHRIALFLPEEPEHDNIVERVEAFKRTAAFLGLEGVVIVSDHEPICEDFSHDMRLSTEARYDLRVSLPVARQLRDSGATAVFSVSDIGACFLMKRFHSMGVRIPDDVSIIGFNDEGMCRLVYPELTTIAQPYAEMAAETIRLLEHPEEEARDLRLEPRLIVRDSTGPAPRTFG